MAFASALRRAAQAQRQTRPPLGSPQQPPMQSMPVPPPMGSGPLMPRVQQQLQQQLGARPLPNLGTAPSTSPPPGSRFIFDAPLPEGMMGTMGGRGYDPVTGRLDLGTAGGSGQFVPQQTPFNPQQTFNAQPMDPQQMRQMQDKMRQEEQLALAQRQQLGLQPVQPTQQGFGLGGQTPMQGGLASLFPPQQNMQPSFGEQSMDMMYRPGSMPTVSPEQRQQQEAQMRAMEQMARQGAQQPMGMGLAGLSQFGQTGTGIAGPMQAQAPQLGQQQFGGQQPPSFGNQSQAPQPGLSGGQSAQAAAPKAAGKLF